MPNDNDDYEEDDFDDEEEAQFKVQFIYSLNFRKPLKNLQTN